MLTRLIDATPARSGGKAAALALLLSAGLPVPDGFVVADSGIDADDIGSTLSLRTTVAQELARMGDPVVAVRSSAMNEDTPEASAAGQYESVIGVRGATRVCDAIATCRASVDAARVDDYWSQRAQASAGPSASGMAVLVQRMIEAELAGVMFTREQAGDPTRIEASWGLGIAVVGGTVTPDAYEVVADGSIAHTVGSKQVRFDLDAERGGVATRTVNTEQQKSRVLDDETVTTLAQLGDQIAQILGSPQDIEWAIADGTVWILQARPITASLPAARAPELPLPVDTLTGAPGSHGTVIGAARIVLGPSDFTAVQPGEIVICAYTDPAWTPLFTIAAGVVTATGGALSHAAIVAREFGIPAVLGVRNALDRIETGDRIAIDGTAGTITRI